MTITDNIDFTKLDGLVPAVIQDALTQRVLMVGFMNAEAVQRTADLGLVTFFSRTRNRLWTKGETSGHTLDVVDMALDCDADSLLITVRANGPGVCHEGYESCFFRSADSEAGAWTISASTTFDTNDVYGVTR